MKKLLSCVALICNAWAVHAQTPDQFSKNAASFGQKRSTEVVRNAFGSTDQWVKIQVVMSDVRWDVKKTDSLLNPVIALVTLTFSSSVSKRMPSKESAQAAEPGKFDNEIVELAYTPTQNGWQFSNGKAYKRLLRTWMAVKPSPDPALFTPYGWLISGFGIPK